MASLSASFPEYHSHEVSLRVGVPAAALPEGLRALTGFEMDNVAGGWPKWVDSLGKGLVKGFCVGFGALVGMVNPIAGGIVGAALWELVDNEWDRGAV